MRAKQSGGLTRVRQNVSGDVAALLRDVARVLPPGTRIVSKRGSIDVFGAHKPLLERWLTLCGF